MSKNEQDSEEITPKQHALILALLSHQTIAEAAKVANVPDSTARRWLRLPHVQNAYKEAQNEVFEEAMSRLKLSTMKALNRLLLEMETADDASVRVRVGMFIVSQSIEQHQANKLTQETIEAMQTIERERQQ